MMRLRLVDRLAFPTVIRTRAPYTARVTKRPINTLIDIPIGVLPERGNAIEIRTHIGVRIVQQVPCVCQGVIPRVAVNRRISWRRCCRWWYLGRLWARCSSGDRMSSSRLGLHRRCGLSDCGADKTGGRCHGRDIGGVGTGTRQGRRAKATEAAHQHQRKAANAYLRTTTGGTIAAPLS